MNNTRTTLLNWVATGDLDAKNLESALKLCQTNPDKQQWLSYLKTGLLWAAILSTTFGIIFFFAFNWHDMGRLSKFALIEVFMLLCAVFLLNIVTSSKLISISLFGMSLLTGALLALVGQTYQTGADPWQLFATWSILILPWAFIARNDVLWSLWIVLINIALYFYLDIHHGLFWGINQTEQSALSFTGLNSVLLIISEIHYSRQIKQHQSPNRRLQQQLAIFAGSAISFLAVTNMFDGHTNPINFIYYSLWLGAAYVTYRHKHPDLFILSAATLSVIIVISSWLVKTIDSGLDDGGFFIITLAIIILSTLAGKWLKNIAKALKNQSHEQSS